MRRRKFLALSLVALLCVACKDEGAITGVMLEISGPSSVQDSAHELRVSVSSGKTGDLVERGIETVPVSEWPAEVFVRASDVGRVWRAEAWALDAEGALFAAGSIEGRFAAGEITTASLRLVASAAAGPDGVDDAGDARGDGGAAEAGIGDDTGAGSSRDAAIATLDARAARDGASIGASDAGNSSAADSAATDASDSSVNDECALCTGRRCGQQFEGCYMSGDFVRDNTCRALQECGETSGCFGQQCYCGVGVLLCLDPQGPCRSQWEVAAGSRDISVVQNASMDRQSAVGRAAALGDCQSQLCRSECGPAPRAQCSPEACANDCAAAGPFRCCTAQGACGCTWAPGASCL